MSRTKDFAALIRGLEKIFQAAAKHQQSELSRSWANSSIRTASKEVNNRVEEKFSDVIVKQSEFKVCDIRCKYFKTLFFKLF